MAHSTGDTTLLKDRLLSLLAQRAYPKTACPSEIPRSLSNSELQDLGIAEWREIMPMMRELAFRLRDEGKIEVLQKGEVVGMDVAGDDVRGPIRVRMVR